MAEYFYDGCSVYKSTGANGIGLMIGNLGGPVIRVYRIRLDHYDAPGNESTGAVSADLLRFHSDLSLMNTYVANANLMRYQSFPCTPRKIGAPPANQIMLAHLDALSDYIIPGDAVTIRQNYYFSVQYGINTSVELHNGDMHHPNLSDIWMTYGDANVQPMTLRHNQGLSLAVLKNSGYTPLTWNVYIEFSQEV